MSFSLLVVARAIACMILKLIVEYSLCQGEDCSSAALFGSSTRWNVQVNDQNELFNCIIVTPPAHW